MMGILVMMKMSSLMTGYGNDDDKKGGDDNNQASMNRKTAEIMTKSAKILQLCSLRGPK